MILRISGVFFNAVVLSAFLFSPFVYSVYRACVHVLFDELPKKTAIVTTNEVRTLNVSAKDWKIGKSYRSDANKLEENKTNKTWRRKRKTRTLQNTLVIDLSLVYGGPFERFAFLFETRIRTEGHRFLDSRAAFLPPFHRQRLNSWRMFERIEIVGDSA